MNYFTSKSIELANCSDYLDQLNDVYPIGENAERVIDDQLWEKVKFYYETKNGKELFKTLMKLPKFPFDDSYVSIFRGDYKLIDNNPKQVQRICNKLFKMDIDEIYRRCKQPKKESREMGECFKRWINKGLLGFPVVTSEEEFMSNNDDVIFNGSDYQLKEFAKKYLGYNREKGLDFIVRIKGEYTIGEAKFISDNGGSQNGQYKDARELLDEPCNENVKKIAIIDGCVYKPSKTKIYKDFTENDINVMSVLTLKDFLHSLYL